MKPSLFTMMLLIVGCGNSNTAILPTSEAARQAAEGAPAPLVKATVPMPNKPGK